MGLSVKFLETKRALIDEQLLQQRNRIAHGSYGQALTDEDAMELIDNVGEMARKLREKAFDFLQNEDFLLMSAS